MSLKNLFVMASMPMMKVLLISALGSFLALDGADILGQNARKHLNKVVFFVFNPALVATNLAKTITFQSFLTLWFMPVNIFITFFVGSILGWILTKITKPPKHLKGLVIGACSAGNLGKLPIIIVPAMCKEEGSPFGAVDVCQSYGLAYASLSMALGAVFMWSYVYNIIRISSRDIVDEIDTSGSEICDDETLKNNTEPLLLPSTDYSLIITDHNQSQLPSRMRQWLTIFLDKINLKAMLAPSTIGAIVGFVIGIIPQLRKLLIGNDAILHVVEDSAFLVGEAAIPTVILILGANLLSVVRVVPWWFLSGSSASRRVVRVVPRWFEWFLGGDWTAIEASTVQPSMEPMMVHCSTGSSASRRGGPGGVTASSGAGAEARVACLKGSQIEYKIVMGIAVIRYILLPLLGIVVVRGAVRLGILQLDPLLQFVLLLQYAMPPAMNLGTMTQLFGRGQSEYSVIMLWTYGIAAISLTLWSTFFLWIVAS